MSTASSGAVPKVLTTAGVVAMPALAGREAQATRSGLE